ncbi:MAG: O-unit flippase [Desulfotalea sp.]|nr:MAG: O-unit flippase [Desulfotalea sp.]
MKTKNRLRIASEQKLGARQVNATGLSRLIKKMRRYLVNVTWLFAGKIVRMMFSLLVGIWVARYLGVEQFGILSYGIAFAMLLRSVAMFQLEGICVREIIKTPAEKDNILGSAFVLSFVAGLFSFLIVVNSIALIRPDDPVYCILVSIVGFGLIFLCFEVFDYWFQSQLDAKPVVVARTIVLSFSAALKVSAILLHAPLVFFAWITLVELILMGGALVLANMCSGQNITKLRVKVKWLKKLLCDAWPLALSGMAATIYLRIDIIMVGEMMGAQDVGIYTAATRLAEAAYFLPICIMATLYPAVVKSLENKNVDSEIRMQQVYNLMILMGYGVGIIATLFAGPVINFLFGEQFQQSSQVLSMYIWSGVFVNIAMAKSAYLKARNFTTILFVSTFTGAVVNVLLNLILIKEYGVTGAVWATIISYSIEAYFILFLFPCTRKQAFMISRAFVMPIIRFKDITS